MDLQIAIHCLPPLAAGSPPLGVEAAGEVSDLLLQALRDRCEVLLVVGNERWIGLGDKMLGKVEDIAGQGDPPPRSI